MKKQEEKRRKQAAEKEAKEKEAKLAAQRAELEAAKEKERLLQLQLESLGDDDSSDDEGPLEITPQETTPTNSQVLSREASVQPTEAAVPSRQSPADPLATANLAPPPAPVPASSSLGGSKNPFFKSLNQPAEQSFSSTTQSSSSLTSPTPADVSTNPFHRLTQNEPTAAKNQLQSQPSFASPQTSSPDPSSHRPSRVRPEEDEWSVVDSTEDSSDEEPERAIGGSAKHLASILFGTMAPPRPLSAMDNKDKPRTPIESPSTPLAPPMPVFNVPPPSREPDSAFDGTAPPAPPPQPPASAPAVPGTPGGVPPPPPIPATFPPNAPPPPPPPAPAAPGLPPPGAGAGRGGLLGEIQKGKGLKKVQTVDKSQAAVTGRVL